MQGTRFELDAKYLKIGKLNLKKEIKNDYNKRNRQEN